jgi:hypothetical protein
MRDARYVRLISWTLQSGSEQLLYTLIKNEKMLAIILFSNTEFIVFFIRFV